MNLRGWLQDLVAQSPQVADSEGVAKEKSSTTRVRYSHAPLNQELQWFAEFDRMAVYDENLASRCCAPVRDLIMYSNRFDDQQRLSARNPEPTSGRAWRRDA